MYIYNIDRRKNFFAHIQTHPCVCVHARDAIGQHAGKREIHDNQFLLLLLVQLVLVHPKLNDMMEA